MAFCAVPCVRAVRYPHFLGLIRPPNSRKTTVLPMRKQAPKPFIQERAECHLCVLHFGAERDILNSVRHILAILVSRESFVVQLLCDDPEFLALELRTLWELHHALVFRLSHICHLASHLRYIQGVTARQFAYREYLKSRHWEWLRWRVFKRDGFRCVKCGSKHGIQAHHLFYRERFEDSIPEDCSTLCRRCHKAAHKRKNRKPKRQRVRLPVWIITLQFAKLRASLDAPRLSRTARNRLVRPDA